MVRLSEEFPDFTYAAYQTCRCFEFLSPKHPKKVDEGRRKQKEQYSNIWEGKSDQTTQSARSEEELRQKERMEADSILYQMGIILVGLTIGALLLYWLFVV